MAMLEACDRHHTTNDVRKVSISIKVFAHEGVDDEHDETHLFDPVLGPRARTLLIDRVKALIKPPVKAATDAS